MKRNDNLKYRFQGRLLAGIMMIALLCASCKSTKQITARAEISRDARTDSVSLTVERLTKVIPVPASRVELTLSIDSIIALPVGARYTEKSGQATVDVRMSESGNVIASATCDSLTLLVDELRTEIYHLNSEKTDFKSELSEQKIVEVNRLTSWQSFQIWTGRICLLLLIILVIKHFKIV
jgi:hypothetical protein